MRVGRCGPRLLAWIALLALSSASAAVLGPPDRIRIEVDGVDVIQQQAGAGERGVGVAGAPRGCHT